MSDPVNIESPGQLAPPGSEVKSWGILELLGHVRLAGLISEEERFGTKMGRIDVPTAAGGFITQYFSGGSIYRLTPCDEATARRVAGSSSPAPVHPWQLPAPQRELFDGQDDEDEEE